MSYSVHQELRSNPSTKENLKRMNYVNKQEKKFALKSGKVAPAKEQQYFKPYTQKSN